MGREWKTVKVFISSTFRDMHHERDHLMRVVFPRLAEELVRYRLHLRPVDLRWGVTAAETHRALEVCLDVLEECRPFFLGLLAGRYGWVPPGSAGESITALEIYRAILAPQSDQSPLVSESFFYFRSPAVTDTIDDPEYRETDPVRIEKLEELKERIRSELARRAAPPPVEYHAKARRVQDPVTGALRLVLEGLEHFGEAVHDQLLEAITRRYADRSDPAHDPEEAIQEAFIASRLAGFVGRSEVLESLRRVTLPPSGEVTEGQSGRFVCVCGGPGSGKSALLAQLASGLSGAAEGGAPRLRTATHFTGASQAAGDIDVVLARLLKQLPEDPATSGTPQLDRQASAQILTAALERAVRLGPVCLIIDALDQLRADKGAHALSWLPRSLPPGVAVILSATESAPLTALRRRLPPASFIDLAPLSTESAVRLAEENLQSRGKRLSAAQLEVLLGKADATKPLYLVVALDELAFTGRFENLDAQVAELPQEIQQLFAVVLSRIEADHGRDLVEPLLSYIALGRDGATEADLCALLAPAGAPVLPSGLWAPLRRTLRPYLIERGAEGELGFFHTEFHAAVHQRYLDDMVKVRQRHGEMARHMARRVFPDGDVQSQAFPVDDIPPRALRDLGLHLAGAHRWDELFGLLGNTDFLEAKTRAGLVQDLAEDFTRTLHASEPWTAMNFQVDHSSGMPLSRRSLALLERSIRRELAFLERHPDTLFQVLYDLHGPTGDPDSLDPLTPFVEFWRHGVQRRGLPWIRQMNRSRGGPEGPVASLRGLPAVAHALAFSPDGNRILASGGNMAQVYEVKSRRLLFSIGNAVSPAFTRDGNWLVAAQLDPGLAYAEAAYATYVRPVHVYDAETGDRVSTFSGHTAFLRTIALAPDGRTAASRSGDTVWLWDIAQAEPRAELKPRAGWPIEDHGFSPDGRFLAAAVDASAVFVFDAVTGRQAARLSADTGTVAQLRFHPTRPFLVLVSKEGAVSVWDLSSFSPVRVFERIEGGARVAEFSPFGHQLAIISQNGDLHLFDFDSGNRLAMRPAGEWSRRADFAFSPDGDWIAVATPDSTIALLDPTNGKTTGVLRGDPRPILALSFSPEGRHLAASYADSTIQLFDLTRSVPARYRPESQQAWRRTPEELGGGCHIQDACFDRNGRRFLAVTRDRLVLVWDPTVTVPEHKLRWEAGTEACWCFFVSEDRRIALLSSAGGRIWDASSGGIVRDMGPMQRWALSPSRAYLARTTSAGAVEVLEMESGRVLWRHNSPASPAEIVLFSPDGKLLAIADAAGRLQIKDTATGALMAAHTDERFAESSDMLFSPDGRRILCLSRFGILWEIDGGRTAVFRKAHPTVAAFHPSGERFAVAGGNSWDDTCYISLFDVHSRRGLGRIGPLRMAAGHLRQVGGLAFSADGTALVATFLDPDYKPHAVILDPDSGGVRSAIQFFGAKYGGRLTGPCMMYGVEPLLRAAGLSAHVPAGDPLYRIVSGDHDLTVERPDGSPLAYIPHRPEIIYLAENPQSPYFAAVAADGDVAFYHLSYPTDARP